MARVDLSCLILKQLPWNSNFWRKLGCRHPNFGILPRHSEHIFSRHLSRPRLSTISPSTPRVTTMADHDELISRMVELTGTSADQVRWFLAIPPSLRH